MSLHLRVRDVDRTRAVRALTAWMSNDPEALDLVLAEANGDVEGVDGLLLGLLTYCDWITRNTGPLLAGDPGPDQDQA